MRFLTISFLFAAFLVFATKVKAQISVNRRIAIVIGIQNYTSITPLRNSLNDARSMSAILKDKGFEVIELFEPKTKRDLQEGLRQYYSLVKDKPNVAGLIYYSGHGVQVDGSNYLIPLSANPQIKADLDDQCVKMDFVMQVLEEAGNSLNILIMDACRNNPFRGFSRATDRGLTIVDAPKGSYVVYSTKPGSVASDGEGVNGLFTSKLLKYMNEPNLNIEQVFKKVAKDVADESNDTQRPWISSDYTGDFYFSQQNPPTDKSKAEPLTLIKDEKQKRQEQKTDTPADMYDKGISLIKEGNVEDGLKYFEKAAEQGDLKSQLELTDRYEKGIGVIQDQKLAFFWCKKAAEQGDPGAQNSLGVHYLNGSGVNENVAAAMNWFLKSSSQNNPESFYNLSTIYLNGRGVNQSEKEAVNWLIKGANMNHIPSINKLGSLYLMGGKEIKKDKVEAIKLFKRASALGDSWAKDTLESLGYN